MVTEIPGDPTFGIFSPPAVAGPSPVSSGHVVVPDVARLTAMSVEDLEDLLLELMVDRSGVSREVTLAGSMSEGSLRTKSVLMLVLMHQVGQSVGREIIVPSDLDEPKRLRTLRGAAEVFYEALARLSKERL